MSTAIRIEPMTRKLRNACIDLRLAPHQHPYVPPMDDVLARARRKRDVQEFCILRDAVLVGYFQLNLNAAETAHYCSGARCCGLEAMMIDRRVQGQGIGLAALRQLPDLVRRVLPEHDRVNLTVNFSNRPAQKLYAACGFVDTGDVYSGAASGPQHIYSLSLSRSVASAEVASAQRDGGVSP